MSAKPRWIAHVDMDAFFVSVELLRRPELRGRPVVVGTGTDPNARGVVMAASYEAREFGVHSALPLAVAHRRCPQAVLIPRDMGHYRQASQRVMEILRGFSERVEVAGLDEAYLDLSGSPVPQARGRQIKHEIRERTGLTASVGLAPNKLLAKIASDLDKPDGFCVLPAERMLEAVGGHPASLIPGVGPRTAERLRAMGIVSVADLAGAPPDSLESAFGPKLGRSLHDRANGIDERLVVSHREQKSESRETTFARDVEDTGLVRAKLVALAGGVCEGLRSSGHAGRTVTVKIRLRPFRTHTRSRTLESPTADPAVIGAVASELLDSFELDAPVRLVGVGVSSLIPTSGEGPGETAQDSLFEARPPRTAA